MPIPLLQPTPEEAKLALAAPAARPSATFPRFLAHALDFCVVQGFSVYAAKLGSIFLLAFYSPSIQAAGRGARPLFHAAWSYSTTELLAASCAVISVLYFVVLPYLTGRTLGLGLLGLRVTGERGEAPSLRQLTLRLLGFLCTYATFGLLALTGFREDGRFWHDSLSGSRVTRD